MAFAYTTAQDVYNLAGEMAIDLRTDDNATIPNAPSVDDLIDGAIDYASGRIDFYCLTKYSGAELASNRWCRGIATLLALHYLCRRRLNEVPSSLQTEWEERLEELKAVQKGTAVVPGAARSRRPAVVSTPSVDLNRRNNQVRVDPNRSTGVAKDYRRSTDTNAPDCR